MTVSQTQTYYLNGDDAIFVQITSACAAFLFTQLLRQAKMQTNSLLMDESANNIIQSEDFSDPVHTLGYNAYTLSIILKDGSHTPKDIMATLVCYMGKTEDTTLAFRLLDICVKIYIKQTNNKGHTNVDWRLYETDYISYNTEHGFESGQFLYNFLKYLIYRITDKGDGIASAMEIMKFMDWFFVHINKDIYSCGMGDVQKLMVQYKYKSDQVGSALERLFFDILDGQIMGESEEFSELVRVCKEPCSLCRRSVDARNRKGRRLLAPKRLVKRDDGRAKNLTAN